MQEPARIDSYGTRCPVCGSPLDDANELVWCSGCETPHHRDCFAYNGRCATYACLSMRYRASPGADSGVTWIEVRGGAVPQAYIIDCTSGSGRVMGSLVAASVSATLTGAAGVLAYLAASRLGSPLAFLGLLPASLAAVASGKLVRRRLVREYFIVDGKTRQVWHHRSLGPRQRLAVRATFASIVRICLARVDLRAGHAPDGAETYESSWVIRLDLQGSPPLVVSDTVVTSGVDDPPHALIDIADRLGRIVGVPINNDPPREGLLPPGLGDFPSRQA